MFENRWALSRRRKIGIVDLLLPATAPSHRQAVRACPKPLSDGLYHPLFRLRLVRGKQRQDRRREFGGWHREPPRLVAGHTRIESRPERPQNGTGRRGHLMGVCK